MKTGIVRRIDELGRVVIPKEIRRTMHLREGEEMEVFVAGEGELVLKKFSQIKTMREFCDEYADLLYRHTGHVCGVTDNNGVVAQAGEKTLENKLLSKRWENFLSGRKSGHFRGAETEEYLAGTDFKELIVVPISLRGDVIGSIFLASKKGMSMPDALVRLLEIAADFLSAQAE